MSRIKRVASLLFAIVFVCAACTSLAFAAAPASPQVQVSRDVGRFMLSWNPVGGVTHYTYLCTDDPNVIQTAQPELCDQIPGTQTNVTVIPTDLVYGRTYYFGVWAANDEGYSPAGIASATLLSQNQADANKLKSAIENKTFSATSQEAPNREVLANYLAQQIKSLGYQNASVYINVSSFTAAQMTQQGSFSFTVSIAIGNPNDGAYGSAVTRSIDGIISSSSKLTSPVIMIETAPQGGLSYAITNAGTVDEAKYIQSYLVTIYDVVNSNAVVTDYAINAREDKGTINLVAGLTGENTYRASVKACSSDTRTYLDSDPSDLSVSAKAGRIPIVLRPYTATQLDLSTGDASAAQGRAEPKKGAQKYYGDTEPVISYEVVSGPDPLPQNVELKISFSRTEGSDAGTYEVSFNQTDTNYAVTLEDASFEILPRPLTITPETREVIYQQGTTFLLEKVGTAEGLVPGDVITSLTFNNSDARGEVGEFAIAPSAAVIMSGSKDVTKNYDITFAPGKLIVHPVGYQAGGNGFPTWLLILLIVLFCALVAGGVFLIWYLRRKKKLAAAAAATDDAAPEYEYDPNLYDAYGNPLGTTYDEDGNPIFPEGYDEYGNPEGTTYDENGYPIFPEGYDENGLPVASPAQKEEADKTPAGGDPQTPARDPYQEYLEIVDRNEHADLQPSSGQDGPEKPQ